MQYRLSLLFLTVAVFLGRGLELLGIVFLFQRFTSIGGWGLAEVAFLYGLVNTAFSGGEILMRGFDIFPGMVQSGDFDRILLRPRSTILQVAGRDFPLSRAGRLAQGLLPLFWSLAVLPAAWTADKVFLLLFALAGGTCLFMGLMVFVAACSFWTIETLELLNVLIYGGLDAGVYPQGIYNKWFRNVFIYIAPLACVTYFPAVAILGQPDGLLGFPAWFPWVSPLAGPLFLLAGLQFWKVGVRHYCSTGN